MCVAFLVNLTAYPFSMGLLPYVAKNVYDAGQTGLGYLSAGVAFGSLLGSLAVSATPLATRAARTMILSVVCWYATLFVFAHAPGLASAIVLLAMGGFMQSVCVTPLAVVMLRIADPAYRGRVMGLRMLAIYGLPIGLVVSGPLIEHLGFFSTVNLYAATGMLAIVLIALRWRDAVWRRDSPANGGR
jgi:predicted MFS family arabinose efflux permease